MLNKNIIWIFIFIHGNNALKDLEECQLENRKRQENNGKLMENRRVVGGSEARPGK